MKIYIIILLMFVIYLLGCGDKMVLPSVQPSIESFGANDTSYIHLNPDWDAATIGYSPATPWLPTDIAIGVDEYIFIADSANNKVVVVSKSGEIVTHQNLNNIGLIEAPVGLDIDAKLNLLIVNGSNTVFAWHQYFNNIGVDSIIIGLNASDSSFIFSGENSLIDSISSIYPFYVDDDLNSSFMGVAYGPQGDNTVFLTDKGNNRIVKLNVVMSSGVLLENRYLLPTFTGLYEADIATAGTGAGTVDNPRGITTDNEGNVYFTQFGSNFLVQKLKQSGNTYISAYTLYQHPIMDLNRFIAPFDIALGESDAIFVVDTGDSGKVSKFYNKGINAGDLVNLGKKGLVEARFDGPRSIAISSDEIVYISNTRSRRIQRYQYSVSDDDLPGDETQ